MQHWKEQWVFFFFFFLNLILPSYWFKNALEYKLFHQTAIVTFVECLLLSPLKVKTMKYYLICNPRKCLKTTCPSLESCQNKVRGKVVPENNNWRLQHVLRSKVEPMAVCRLPVSLEGFPFIFLNPHRNPGFWGQCIKQFNSGHTTLKKKKNLTMNCAELLCYPLNLIWRG